MPGTGDTGLASFSPKAWAAHQPSVPPAKPRGLAVPTNERLAFPARRRSPAGGHAGRPPCASPWCERSSEGNGAPRRASKSPRRGQPPHQDGRRQAHESHKPPLRPSARDVGLTDRTSQNFAEFRGSPTGRAQFCAKSPCKSCHSSCALASTARSRKKRNPEPDLLQHGASPCTKGATQTRLERRSA